MRFATRAANFIKCYRTNNAIEAIVASWRWRNVPLKTGLAAVTIRSAFATIGRMASSDVVAIYSQCNGMEPGAEDNHLFSLWSVEESVKEAARYDPEFIPFGDFLLCSHEYCFHYETPDRSSVYVSGRSSTLAMEQVGSSVEEFFSLLANDPDKVYAG